ncbi:TPA: DNA cytosine methyltransferase [Pasteurella multocida]|nr:DNA cytosine methyltransferase [Pasteurella multocida]HEA3307763.1 DNA cytosine methyltransferase [Pasteurella multocida]
MNYISFFSGALGLDLGLEKGGLNPLLFCEVDKHCQQTIKKNKPNVPLVGDIREQTAEKILEILSQSGKNQKIDLVVGGPPCQAFSTAGARKSFEDDRGNVFLHFLKIATDLKPKYIVIENVRGLLSATYSPSNKESKKGSALEYIVNFLEEKGYQVSFNLYNAANFGVPQIRERVVIIASSTGSKVPYLQPTHEENSKFDLKPWRTLKDTILDIPAEKNLACAAFPEKRLKYYRLLTAGQNWKNLPLELQKEAMGKSFELGGGKTGFLRRLDWNKPSPTLVTSPTMPATDLAHPVEDRPLSVAEYARIQQFPDHWVFSGKLTEQYKQIGNAVPCGLGFAIAKAILNHHQGIEPTQKFEGFKYSRYKFTNEKNWQLAF